MYFVSQSYSGFFTFIYFLSADHSLAGVSCSDFSVLFPVVFGSHHLYLLGGTTGQTQLLLQCQQLLPWIKYFQVNLKLLPK